MILFEFDMNSILTMPIFSFITSICLQAIFLFWIDHFSIWSIGNIADLWLVSECPVLTENSGPWYTKLFFNNYLSSLAFTFFAFYSLLWLHDLKSWNKLVNYQLCAYKKISRRILFHKMRLIKNSLLHQYLN